MATNQRARLGFIGLGQMGAPMARNLMKAGYPLTVHNRSRGIVEQFASEGAQTASSPREVAERVDVLFTCVGFPADVQTVYLGPDGAVLGAHEGQVFCDLSTVDPATHHRIAAALAGRGVQYLDAPVSGGVSGARDATLTIMVGGESAAFERIRPYLAAMGKNIHLVGPGGAGATIKLVNQMMGAICALGAAEGLVLATKAGIDPGLAYEILRTSSGASRALDGLAQSAFARNFAPGFTVDLQHKDVSLAVQLGRELGVRLLGGAIAEQVIQETRGAGYGSQSQTSAILVHERIAGVEVTPKKAEPA
ncbi:MAG: NAD(P)-dependent oxidoreductase [Chloroflexi bacterium]|nr:NAD(P)-dependent oxidoreductase [Chloroflexota bacterium]